MAILRFKALETVEKRTTVEPAKPAGKVAEFFGTNVFSKKTMRDYLSPDVFKELNQTIEAGTKLNGALADAVAQGMKNWAIAKGATHFTHWFQPLTESTAEKHDAFFDLD